MLCQECHKREAQVHLTKIVNNEKTTLALCRECADAHGFNSPLSNVPFPLAEILKGMAGNIGNVLTNASGETLTCPKCNLTFEEFTRQGRFGCGECYKAFRVRLEPIMRKIHGATLHRGTAPLEKKSDESGGALIPVKEEERLEAKLREAIANEEFEKAAEIRDKLRIIRESSTVDK
jgi:protein arginine kinase activator